MVQPNLMMRRLLFNAGFFLASLLALSLGTASPALAQFVESKITANDGDPNDRFGESVAIDGSTAVIGAFRDDDAGSDAGAAYVFELSNGTWTQSAKLIPDNGLILPGLFDNGLFGGVVAIHNDVIVVGAVDARENGIRTGAAYVFGQDEMGNWVQQERLIAEDGAINDKYGAAVATNGDFVMIGALDADHSNFTNPGAVYVYERNPEGSDVTWNFVQKLIPGDTQEGDSFGWSVAMSGNRAIIGARDVDDQAENAGAAYIYELNGGEWIEVEKIFASDAKVDDSFGEIVAIHEEQVIVGARDVDIQGEESGAAYIFERNNEGDWVETAKLLASDGESLDRFGNSVAIEGNYAVVSTRIDNDFSGAVYVFQRIGDSWTEIAKLTPANLEAGDLFGQGVAISETRIVSGTKGDDDEGLDAGAAHIFELEDADRAALVALYNATDGPNWSRRNNWLSNAPLSNWYGVETNDDGQVTELNLESNNLKGDFPIAVAGLPALKRLILRNNNLSGQIPADVQAASLLETLDAGENMLTLPLPDNLGDLQNLQTLLVDNNNFMGPVPEVLTQLQSLQILYLNDNAFNGSVPEKFGGINTLRVLHLQNNNIVDLPPFGNDQPNLVELYVFNNILTFEDLEPQVAINDFQYVPQPNIGEARTLSATENNPVVIQVQTGGNSNVYQWKKDGEVIAGATEDSYVIASASPADAGEYVLEVTNLLAQELRLISEPITLNVTPVVNYASNLSSLHVVPPLLSPANGQVTATLVGNTLSIAGNYDGLAFPFGTASLHAGAPGVSTEAVYELDVTATNETSGVFEAGNNAFDLSEDELLTLQNGLFYISIETESGSIADPFSPELRGQVYIAPNGGPNTPEIAEPANGASLNLEDPGDLTITWNAVADPDGHPVQYIWAFSRNPEFEGDLTLIEGIFRTGDNTFFSISNADLDAFLASQGIAQGASVTLYHLVGATDGSQIARSESRSIELTRSTNNQPPRLESPVADFNYLLDDGPGSLNLAEVFVDPDGDDLTFEANSSEQSVATVAIDDASLTITPLAIGNTTITLSATDVFDENVTDEFILTINSRPVVSNTVADQTLFESDDPLTVSVTGVFTDADPIGLSVNSSNEGVVTAMLVDDDTAVMLTPIGVGFADVTLVAEDDKGASASTSFQVLVQADMIMPPQSLAESINISFGNPDLSASYRLVALPGTVNLPMATAVNGTPEVDWIAYRDNGMDVDDREAYFERYDGSANFTFRPGGGFWLLSRQVWERTDSRPTVQLANDGTYSIPLQAGWNIISNPFDIDIPWQAVAQTNEITQQLFRWQGRYIASPVFSSATTGNAFYFFNSENLTTLKLPYIPATSENVRRPAVPAFTLSAVVAGDTLTSIRAGRHMEAAAGTDKFDQIAPPGAFEAASLRLVRPGVSQTSRQGYLTEEFLPAESAGYRYEITLQAPTDGPVELHADGFSHFQNHEEILLIDRKLGKRYDFRKNPSLTFWPESNIQQYVLLIGDAAFVAEEQANLVPESLALLPNYPNPFAQTTTIAFALPEPENLRIVVYNTLGRRVRVLAEGTYNAGHHQLSWDGLSDAGAALGSGLYFYQLQLQDKQIVRSMMLRR